MHWTWYNCLVSLKVNADCTGSICIYLSIKYIIAMLCFLLRSVIRLSILQRYHGHGEALYALFPQKLYHILKQFLIYKYCLFLQFYIEILTKFRVKQHLKALQYIEKGTKYIFKHKNKQKKIKDTTRFDANIIFAISAFAPIKVNTFL